VDWHCRQADEEFSEDKEADINDDKYEGFAFHQKELLCSIQNNLAIPKDGLYLTAHQQLMCSPTQGYEEISMMKQVTAMCNVLKTIVTKRGELKVYGRVAYHLEAIANILSLRNVQMKYTLIDDSCAKTGYIVHKVDGTNCVFKPSKKGWLPSDFDGDTVHFLFNMVDRNKSKYTVKQYTNVHLIQNIIGHLVLMT